MDDICEATAKSASCGFLESVFIRVGGTNIAFENVREEEKKKKRGPKTAVENKREQQTAVEKKKKKARTKNRR